MDANQQRFWMIADTAAWSHPATDWESVEFDKRCRRLRLRDRRPPRPDPAVASPPLSLSPSPALDAFGTVAYWDSSDHALKAHGGLGPNDEPIGLWIPPANQRVVDLAFGFDDVLYLAIEEGEESDSPSTHYLGLFDPRGRWRKPIVPTFQLPSFSAHRLAADPSGGVWALDREQKAIGRFRGLPLRDGLPPSYAPTTFRPDPENPNRPSFQLDPKSPTDWEPQEIPIELSCSPTGALALISRRDDGETRLRIRQANIGWTSPKILQGAGQASALAWISQDRLCLLPSTGSEPTREAIPYDAFDNSPTLIPVGGFYPLRHASQPARFYKGVTYPPHYPVSEKGRRIAQLRPLSIARFTSKGEAYSKAIDCGEEESVWHRLCLEAIFPAGCGASVFLAATDDPTPDPIELEWHEHRFGDEPEDAPEPSHPSHRPARGAWISDRSEIPHHEGLLGRAPEAGRVGLFTALIQRPGRSVRRLQGRFLHLRAALRGTNHQTPEIAAIRAYASRFSYRDEYLPELYRENRFGSDADQTGPATGADFLERYLSLFESALTPMEDRAASAQVVMDPRSTPDDAVDWLGSWVGAEFGESLPIPRRRAWIEASHRLNRTKGTLVGLQLALEIATGGRLDRAFIDSEDARERIIVSGGGVTGGEIVALEDYRLRRAFATILGTNLSLEDDPLLPGLIVSANSRLGDALILGEAEKQELLALYRGAFSEDEQQRAKEIEDVRAFYRILAHRITIFVHDSVEKMDFGLIERIARREAPAHVKVNVVRASYPLLVGLASLVGVDTYLGPEKKPSRAVLDQSRLGENDFVYRRASLDPRLEGDSWDIPLPVARAEAPPSARADESVTLDGSRSTAARGRSIDRYTWTLRPPT